MVSHIYKGFFICSAEDVYDPLTAVYLAVIWIAKCTNGTSMLYIILIFLVPVVAIILKNGLLLSKSQRFLEESVICLFDWFVLFSLAFEYGIA